MNAFNIPLENVNEVLDVQFQLVKYGVGTYEEFAGVIGNVIPSATRAGQSIETVSAMLAFLTRNGLSASMAATSAARALEAMSHPKTIARLAEMGIQARDAAGNMRPMTDVLKDLRAKLEAMPPADRVKALVELLKGAGGTIQARRFLEQVLLRPGELEELEFYLSKMEGAQGAFGDAYNTMADSVAAKTQLLKNQWMALKIAIGEAVIPAFLILIGMVSRVVEAFNNLPDSTKNIVGQFMVWGSVLAVVGGIILVFLGGLAALVAAFVAGGTALAIFIAVVAALAGYVGTFVAFWTAVWAASNTFREGLMKVIDAMRQLWDAVTTFLAPIAQTIRSTFIDKIMEGLRIVGSMLGTVFSVASSVITGYLVPALSAAKTWWDANQSSIQPLISLFGQVMKWVIIVAGVIMAVLVSAAFASLVATISIVVASFMVVIYVISAVVGAFRTAWGAVQGFINWINNARWAILTWVASATQAVGSLRGTIMGFFAGAGQWLYNAGRNIIQGLVNGIKSAIGAVKGALSSVTSMIPDWKGPKAKDLRLLRPTGGFLMKGLAMGIKDGYSEVKSMLGGITTDIGSGRPMGNTPVSPQNTAPKYDQTFNITTQEIDPRVHAAELGWEVMAVMP
jgi:TP901 family phage tail tape measure protein